MTIVSFSKGTGALSTITQIQKAEGLRTTSISKISSSLKIRKASDAVADSAIGTKLKVEVESLKQLLVGTAQAKAALDIAEGGLGEITKTLTRMNTLAMSAKNGIYKAEDIEKINQEFVALIDEIGRIARATNFNSKQLLSGTETVIQDTFSNTHLGEDLRDGFLSSDDQGIEVIKIDNSKSNTAYTLSYDQTTRLFQIVNLNDKSQVDSVKVAADTIKEGSLESLNFSKFGITIKLNSNFDKDRSIGTNFDYMMDPSLNNDNLKNKELVNSIDESLIEPNPDITILPKYISTMDSKKFRIDGGTQEISLSGLLNNEENDPTDLTKLDDIQKALGIKFPTTGGDVDITIEMAKSGGTLGPNSKAIEAINSTTDTQSVTITSVKFEALTTDDGTAGGTPVTFTDKPTLSLDPSDKFKSFKMTAFDHETGTVTFEATQLIKATQVANTAKSNATITGTFQLDKGTYKNGVIAIDYNKQFIVKDVAKDEAVVLKGGTYKLRDDDIVASDGYVYDKNTGNKRTTLQDNPNSTVQLKLDNNRRTNDVDVVRIGNKATDLSSFDVKIKGTNGKAILYIEAEEGNFESEELNLTDIEYNDGNNTDTYDSQADNKAVIAKTRLTRGQVKLSRVITNGQREDSIVLDLNKLRTGGLIKTKKPEFSIDAVKNMITTNLIKIDVYANDSTNTPVTWNDVSAKNKETLRDAVAKQVQEKLNTLAAQNKAFMSSFANLEAGSDATQITSKIEDTTNVSISVKVNGSETDVKGASDISANIVNTKTLNLNNLTNDSVKISTTINSTAKLNGFKKGVFVSINELKNTVVAFQKTSDKANLSFQVGTGSSEANSVKVTIDSITPERLNLIDPTTGKSIELTSDQDKLQDIISIVQAAIDKVQVVRSEIAVGDNRLGVADSSIQTSITNSQAAVSAIFDLDIPSEMVELSQSEMMEQSSIEALAREMRAKQNLMKLF